MQRDAFQMAEARPLAFGGGRHPHHVEGRAHPAEPLPQLDCDRCRRHGQAEHVCADTDPDVNAKAARPTHAARSALAMTDGRSGELISMLVREWAGAGSKNR